MLDALDAAGSVRDEGPRAHEVFSFRLNPCVVHITQPGSSESTTYHVPARSLSAVDMSFLFGSYVHSGTKCVAQLVSTHGAWQDVVGSVAGCDHVKGLIHEVRVQFEDEIDVSRYCADASRSRVLLVEDNPFFARLTMTHLGRLKAEVTHVSDGVEAIEAAARDFYDIILMDMEMPKMDGFEATRTLRSTGYAGTIVALTALTGPDDKDRCLEAGCDQYLAKPHTIDDLKTVVRAVNQEPLYSTLADDPMMTDLVVEFISGLRGKIKAIEEARANNDVGALEKLARTMKGEAGGYGFEPITDAAGDLEKSVRGGDLKQIAGCVAELVRWCLLVRSSARSDGGASGGNK